MPWVCPRKPVTVGINKQLTILRDGKACSQAPSSSTGGHRIDPTYIPLYIYIGDIFGKTYPGKVDHLQNLVL